MSLLWKWTFLNLRLSMRLNLWPLPLLLVTNGLLLLQWARSNMMPFYFALEANNLGRILDLFLALIFVHLGLLLLIGVESKSTFVIGGFLHTQDIGVWTSLHDTFLSLSSKK